MEKIQWWRTRFINESGEKDSMIWVADLKYIRRYFRNDRPECKNVKIDPLKV